MDIICVVDTTMSSCPQLQIDKGCLKKIVQEIHEKLKEMLNNLCNQNLFKQFNGEIEILFHLIF